MKVIMRSCEKGEKRGWSEKKEDMTKKRRALLSVVGLEIICPFDLLIERNDGVEACRNSVIEETCW